MNRLNGSSGECYEDLQITTSTTLAEFGIEAILSLICLFVDHRYETAGIEDFGVMFASSRSFIILNSSYASI